MKPFNALQSICCRRKCLAGVAKYLLGPLPTFLPCLLTSLCNISSGAIPLNVLNMERQKFVNAGGQIARKVALINLCDRQSPTKWSLLSGLYRLCVCVGNFSVMWAIGAKERICCYSGFFQVCWRAVSILSGMSFGVMQSVAQTPKAR